MEWMQHSAIAEIDGPRFLVFYGAVVAVMLAWCWWTARGATFVGAGKAPEVPSDPDPYELAYLRADAREVARLAIFTLVERGYLALRRGRPAGFRATVWVERRPNYPEPAPLSEIERAVFGWFAVPRSGRDAFGRPAAVLIEPHCHSFRWRLEEERLLIPRADVRSGWWPGMATAAVILGLGGLKLTFALSKGSTNVGSLVLAGSVALLFLPFACRTPRLTRRGRTYLQRLRLAFSRLRQQFPINGAANQKVFLVAGLFGMNALVGTSFGYYPTMVHAGSASNGMMGAGYGGGSSACGSSGGFGCGGAGGGGGCGGCGCGCGD